jgi:uncharacterized membrane protein
MKCASVAIAVVTIIGAPVRTFGDPAADLGGKALEIFSAKCAACHDAGRGKVKGQFGYVLDLARLAGTPKLVVRFHPEQSKLWKLIAEEEMPPEESKAGPLNNEQKKLIRLWIEQGAPAVADVGGRGKGQVSFLPRSLGWLGRFHVVVVHFPIAFLMAAAVIEAWRTWRGSAELVHTLRFCLRLGAAGAVAAAVLGWTRASFSGYSADTTTLMSLHRWLGTGAAASSIVAVLCVEWCGRGQSRSVPYRTALIASAILVSLAGHFGGLIVHGQDFLTW